MFIVLGRASAAFFDVGAGYIQFQHGHFGHGGENFGNFLEFLVVLTAHIDDDRGAGFGAQAADDGLELGGAGAGQADGIEQTGRGFA